MSILGGGNKSSPDSPEDMVEHEEQSIIEDMESLQDDIEEAIDSEERLYRGIEQGLPENKIEDRLASIQIYLQDDIEPEDKTLHEELQSLRNHEQQLQASKPLMENHQKLLNIIKDAIQKADEEIKRLEEVVEESEKNLQGEGFSREQMENLIRKDEQEAQTIEEEIERAREVEKQISNS
jgi:chromosome segregation ATPase